MRRVKNPKRRGAATVELAVLLPILAFLCVIAMDWARVMYYTMCVNTCARTGALWASDAETRMKSNYSQYANTPTAIPAAQFTALEQAASPNITLQQQTIPNYYTDAGGASMVEVTVTYQFSTLANIDLRPWLPLHVPKTQTITRKVKMLVSPLNTK